MDGQNSPNWAPHTVHRHSSSFSFSWTFPLALPWPWEMVICTLGPSWQCVYAHLKTPRFTCHVVSCSTWPQKILKGQHIISLFYFRGCNNPNATLVCSETEGERELWLPPTRGEGSPGSRSPAGDPVGCGWTKRSEGWGSVAGGQWKLCGWRRTHWGEWEI